jgi:hypothetical protein
LQALDFLANMVKIFAYAQAPGPIFETCLISEIVLVSLATSEEMHLSPSPINIPSMNSPLSFVAVPKAL